MRISIYATIFAIMLFAGVAFAARPNATESKATGGDFIKQDWKASGLFRTGTVWVPDDESKRPAAGWPVVFVFHGHGGSDVNAQRSFHIETSWPDAIVVYPKGLPTKGMLTDPEGNRAGWDMKTEAENNRDVRLFDAIMTWLKQNYKIDEGRVFSTGHSNGGGFTYYLWAYRSDKLAGVAPSAAALGTFRDINAIKPKPALIIAGKKDPLVKFEWQDRMIEQIKKINQCSKDGKPWGEDCTWYDSAIHAPLVAMIHDGGHIVPKGATEKIVEFFKQCPSAKK